MHPSLFLPPRESTFMPHALSLQQAVVTQSQPGFSVRFADCDTGVPVQLAAGVLLQPAVGDTVAVLRGMESWIIAVLTRANATDAAVLGVGAAASMVLQAPLVELRAHELRVQAAKATAHLGSVKLSARVMKVVGHRLAVWADLLLVQANSLATRAEQRVTRIGGADVLNAGQIHSRSEELTRIDSDFVQIQAKRTVMVDGKRIHMG